MYVINHVNWSLFFDFEYHFIHKETTDEIRGASKKFCSLVPPLAVMTALRRHVVDWQMFRMILWRIFCHSFNKAFPNSCRFWGWGWWLRTRLSSLSSNCSIGFKYVDIAGQFRTSVTIVGKKFFVNLAVCARALSY